MTSLVALDSKLREAPLIELSLLELEEAFRRGYVTRLQFEADITRRFCASVTVESNGVAA